MKIEGSVVLVTGANRGLGRAIVLALVKGRSGQVYAAARDERKLAAPRFTRRGAHARHHEAGADCNRREQSKRRHAPHQQRWRADRVQRSDDEPCGARHRLSHNVHGMLAVIKAFLPVLERAPGGATIVNVLSLASFASFPALGGYSASKAAAYSITQALRPELRAKQIDILAVLPGPIDTDMVRALQLPKTSAADTVEGVLAGIARGDEEIFPDPMAEQMSALWNKSHKEYERAFASF